MIMTPAATSTMISVAGIYRETIVDGSGLRTSVYGAGCSHACNGCHNPQTWYIDNGTWLSVQEVFDQSRIAHHKISRGITFSGGDPMYQAKAFLELAKMVKSVPNKSIWCYTGYLFEDLICDRDDKYALLEYVDVLVDGRYVRELRDLTLAYRGSSNQRFIDVQESLKRGATVEYILSKF